MKALLSLNQPATTLDPKEPIKTKINGPFLVGNENERVDEARPAAYIESLLSATCDLAPPRSKRPAPPSPSPGQSSLRLQSQDQSRCRGSFACGGRFYPYAALPGSSCIRKSPIREPTAVTRTQKNTGCPLVSRRAKDIRYIINAAYCYLFLFLSFEASGKPTLGKVSFGK